MESKVRFSFFFIIFAPLNVKDKDSMMEMLSKFDFQEMISAFIVLFAVIDILGSVPIILNLKEQGRPVNAWKATLISFALMLLFFFAGDLILKLFNVDIQSFAIAGALIIFLMSLEMLLDVKIFKNTGPVKEATLVPIVFPLLAGAGVFTTLISLRAMYADINILIGLTINMIWVYFVIHATDKIQPYIEFTFRVGGNTVAYALNEEKRYQAEVLINVDVIRDDQVVKNLRYILVSESFADSVVSGRPDFGDVQNLPVDNGDYYL